ncbi:GNAT family N-acetyltransferase [Cognatiyoonia sp. IB215182]|uniref:GNAT family N-acetyltransferase n=1 Tax=Cognatiyoonia sp. IB215182 TaxID=3097353 RepID=UPI002A0D4D85|nr:GNAT family N-acetyltransferase [Cognatiyoonia sp. IB215182]MDX8353561.1 GNAT family N-acetyltransferase [Cognatiyoonia sp. IB215182]
MPDLTHRNIRTDDFEDLHAMVSHWSVTRQLGGWPWPADPDFTRSRCKPYEGDGFIWAVCLDDRLIGSIGVTNGDLGYMLNPAHHGQGIMRHAARTAVDHAFQTSERDHLTGSTWYDNPTSARLLERLGFLHWQTAYIRSKARGFPVLVHHRRLTRVDWEKP